MTWWLLLIVFGVNFLFWGGVGALRLVDEALQRRRARRGPASTALAVPSRSAVRRHQVGVLMAAHNEELVITNSLRAIKEHLPASNIHVVSDNSNDATTSLARAEGVNVIETPTGSGKAGALVYGLQQFALCDRYGAVLILDADTRLDKDYFDAALPWFDDPGVGAVAGFASTRWEGRLGALGNIVVCHRERVYQLTQRLLKYGQCWRGISATHIVPGFASMYRTSALREIQVNAPGLVIEDFNMTFELNARRLGRVAFTPGAKAYTQDPSSLGDYVKQTRRWALGLWQTIRRNFPGRFAFSATLAVMMLETLFAAVTMLALPLAVLLLLAFMLFPGLADVSVVGPALTGLASVVSLKNIALFVLLPDYLLSVATAIVTRRPRFLLAGLAFMPMRIVDAWVLLSTLPQAWLSKSNGQWTSPTRRAVTAGSGPLALPAAPSTADQELQPAAVTGPVHDDHLLQPSRRAMVHPTMAPSVARAVAAVVARPVTPSLPVLPARTPLSSAVSPSTPVRAWRSLAADGLPASLEAPRRSAMVVRAQPWTPPTAPASPTTDEAMVDDSASSPATPIAVPRPWAPAPASPSSAPPDPESAPFAARVTHSTHS